MNNENADVTTDKPKRVHDQVPSELFANFMKSGWTPSELTDIAPLDRAMRRLRVRVKNTTSTG